MPNENFDNQENLNVGFRDIFINSAVACLLLFFIFSIRSGLFDFGISSQNTISSKGQRNYAFEAEHAKIVEESEHEGSYHSILGVELVKSKNAFTQKAVDQLISGNGVRWDNPNPEKFDEYYSLNPTNNTLTIYLVLGATSKDKIRLKFNNHEVLNELVSIKGFMIDGASAIRNNKVKCFKTDTWARQLLTNREMVFTAVKLKEDQTIDINKAIRLR